MSLDGTYAGLQASIADWLNRADLTAQIPDFITLAHADLNQRLRVRQMVNRATITIAAELVNLPVDWVAPISLRIQGQGVLSCIDSDAMAEQKFEGNDQSSTPSSYCVVGSQFEFGPIPGQSYTGLLVYYAQVPPLSISNPTNWLLTTSPGLYLFGALMAAAPFLKDDARLETWGQLAAEAFTALQQSDEIHGQRLSPRTAFVV